MSNYDRAGMIEERADRISDPVKRLRYLRARMAEPAAETAPPPRRLGARHLWWVLCATVVLAIAVMSLTPRRAEATPRAREVLAEAAPKDSQTGPVPHVWRVERTETAELYSNGLRVDLTFAVSNRPRESFPIFPVTGGPAPRKRRSTPAGIVFHTTESHLAPFEEEQTRRLRQLGRNALEVVRERRAYHYVIDRFGRVFSVVAESDAANHAGHSIWADSDGIYVNLNDSFLGVSFEGQTDAADQMTPAQTGAARLLTEMLRSRYGISAQNCVTHAQVSVSPVNMRAGSHTDWAGNFPFAEVGLPDNYSIPPASVYVYGFEYDDAFVAAVAGRWIGLNIALDRLERQASAQHLSIARYRAILRHRYQEVSAALRKNSEGDI